jgi:hypothetical protein
VKNEVSAEDAVALANLFQIYYGNPEKYRWVETFNHRPSEFQFEAFVDDLDRLPA